MSKQSDEPAALYIAPIPLDDDEQPRIRRVLITNRGEIACRIAETCRKLGVTAIAVYVDEDATSKHILEADEAIGLGAIDQKGGNPYLNISLLIQTALSAGADAVHPGYGYLSENAAFATAVREAGIAFIGPSSHAMSTLGDKRSAKAYLREHDSRVPLIPGAFGASQDVDDLQRFADEMGYPVMLKASAGGGGKGMRIVREASAFPGELRTAQSEAARFFGSTDCILEKYIEAGKHIEIQIIGDKHGNVYSLGERECSVQRRHQKVVEETPSPWLDAAKRQEMSEAAVRVAKLLGYENAGTVEFVFDVQTGKFYFLEVNTRLQVEHPITEEVTRLDIVSLQLFVAAGGDLSSLPPLQSIQQIGHAIECRLCAEDPSRDFFPQTGIIRLWQPAKLSEAESRHVRFETGVRSGSQISIHFDPMIAKIVVWAPTRGQARNRLARVLAETACIGVRTNQQFLQKCLLNPGFSNPGYTTSFIPQNLPALLAPSDQRAATHLVASLPLIAGYILSALPQYLPRSRSSGRAFAEVGSGFRNQNYDRVNRAQRRIVLMPDANANMQPFLCSWDSKGSRDKGARFDGLVAPLPKARGLTKSPAGAAAIYNTLSNALRSGSLPGEVTHNVAINSTTVSTVKSGVASWLHATTHVSIDGVNYSIDMATEREDTSSSSITHTGTGVRAMCHLPHLGTWVDLFCFSVLSYFEHLREASEGGAGEKLRIVTAPMPCKVLSVLKKDGDSVKAGEKLIVVESMKMEININAAVDGTFRSKVQEQDAVNEGTTLCVVE
ncbi:hypothetical protein CKM354_000092100 [Cercospora kikuchii]|uniref:Uncharacterized protein n=1 Tax=Cercospora kikuchii TaxID=84275 RepID=A0A9P3C9T9_9PEZI|nr:uncharacterized protein CKM354_000092100 [Cercospora kikuchii]GIZ37476.1 hypothetical protein CKM354_000092100 [Cercospora kikuchii]